MNGIAIITADHGNAEVNIDEQTGEKHTAHTTNMVPFILASNSNPQFVIRNSKSNNTLADIAPTILELMNLKKPASMTGKSLIQK
jgi:2,3-bisphosphoglycerate-independent phosphoglycerate mutase